jgi:GH24 family phage-related lysozyme (muramidase)
MRASVRVAFPKFSERFEGRMRGLYTDIKGLVTTGVGYKVDPVGDALVLPLKHFEGTRATSAEIAAEWWVVKRAWPGVQSVACEAITKLRLDDADVDELTDRRLTAFEVYIRRQFGNYEQWPADGQLAILSNAWAQGPGFAGWPHLMAALNASPPAFSVAGGQGDEPGEAWLREEGNPQVHARNVQNKILWANAAQVQAAGLDPERLYWPGSAALEVG